MNIIILPFTIDSYDAVLALWMQCDGIGLSDADSKENIMSYLVRNPGMSFLVRIDGELVGAILGGHDGRRSYIYHLAVRPGFRRQGIGRKLVNRCLVELKLSGIKKCHILVFNGNDDGIAFWKSLGWKQRKDIDIMSMDIELS